MKIVLNEVPLLESAKVLKYLGNRMYQVRYSSGRLASVYSTESWNNGVTVKIQNDRIIGKAVSSATPDIVIV